MGVEEVVVFKGGKKGKKSKKDSSDDDSDGSVIQEGDKKKKKDKKEGDGKTVDPHRLRKNKKAWKVAIYMSAKDGKKAGNDGQATQKKGVVFVDEDGEGVYRKKMSTRRLLLTSPPLRTKESSLTPPWR